MNSQLSWTFNSYHTPKTQITVVLLGFLIVGAIAFHLFSEVSFRWGYFFFFFITLELRVE